MANGYESYLPYNAVGSVMRQGALGAPPGVVLPSQLVALLRDLVGTLGLPDAGVVTPWAGRISDVTWKEIVKPDTNIATYEMSDANLAAANEALFGQPIPFLAVTTGRLHSDAELQRILEDAPYDLYETTGVYRQDDPNVVPRIVFFHWLKMKDVPDLPARPKTMGQVAQEMGGVLRFAQQVPVETSTVRAAPTLPFKDVMAMQLNPNGVPANNTPVNQPVNTIPEQPWTGTQTSQPNSTTPTAVQPAPSPNAKSRLWLGLIAVGVGATVATVAVGRSMRK